MIAWCVGVFLLWLASRHGDDNGGGGPSSNGDGGPSGGNDCD